MIEQYDLRKKIELYSILFLLLIALIYGGFRSYPLLAGPSITIYLPNDGDIVSSSTFLVSGRVLRTKEITLQGRPIKIDTEGNFREILVSHAPYTILVLVAKDQYGATITKTLRVIPK